ncbi:uncharacterized protein K452DRAFT_222464 [Aplosporella prunicola CBS 121167]|uniref:Translation initiation factor IF-2, mitochondrial n=1 Tax=Aplosporella prunicola CBS 121167 TaxID=1176127 RepID=A0A6A6BMD4_9PEZI|nr:uncharacterized protein K452DRAFT_222464 [Aplosporella prunicola CBS 121167]KAF2144563.1 hypothetical protein K452DRAFT_222464 [Aplosporella prunicola CBS 121167]
MPAEAEESTQKGKKGGKSSRKRGGNDEEEDYARASAERKAKRREQRAAEKAAAPTPIAIPEYISVANLASMVRVRTDQFIRKMEELGFEDIQPEDILNEENAGLIAMEYNFEPIAASPEDDVDLRAAPEPEDKSSLPQRPPIVTIMGHVDHGKTTLLDYLRKSSVVATEFGGITQHIGAFSVPLSSGKTITFLDTPGHAAFLNMRQRGANVTDIVVLVVAADDSVKPQTLEAIKHAKGARVPIIVAINKVDKEGANPDRVKQDLARHGVDVEDFGGDIQAINVSGKTGQGIDELEEAIGTLSEVLDYRADPTGAVEGRIIEASTKKSGRTATLLIKRGTLRVGDIIVAGTTFARVRTMRNEGGEFIDQVTPGMPAEVDGWRGVPVAGDEVLQAPNEQRATAVIEYRERKEESEQLAKDMEAIAQARKLESARREEKEAAAAAKEAAEAGVEVADTKTAAAEAKDDGPPSLVQVPFILKADVSGSAEAVMDYVMTVGNSEVRPVVLRSEFGAVSEFDVEHAAVAGGHIISFNVALDPRIAHLAEQRGVRVLEDNVIYRLVDAVKALLSERLPPTMVQRVTGEAQVLQTFSIGLGGRRKMLIAGCRVKNGVMGRGHRVRVFRGEKKIYDGTVSSLKNVKKDVAEMRKGTECGMAFDGWQDFQANDTIQCYEERAEKRYL